MSTFTNGGSKHAPRWRVRKPFQGVRPVMRDPESVRISYVAVRLTELQARSPLHKGDEPLRITTDASTASLIRVLADIIMATCVSIEPIVPGQLWPSDEVRSPEQ